ncbi:MFS transporter [Halomonas dongshanensis]|uniref:MFS transporter n=1 Tax=Halomonas dongshanensis TaxID=2890835 RepID=A0ABT2EGV7_9GAMM|nr:MFS transporter [Halomonas dongshanensis]MCS2610847.1 MFS transporter [Halomonas dongshanensis]
MRLFQTRPGDDGLPGRERALAVLALTTGTLLAVMDTTMVNLALPTMAADLDVPASRAVWITNIFQVVCAAFLLVFAGLSELVTRRRLYLFGLGTFLVGSLGAALSRHIDVLLLFRALQGLGAAATLSIGPSLYRMIFPSRLLGSALGLSALVVAGGYAAGPTLSGLLLSVVDWPWLFAFNLPLGVCSWWLARRALPRETPRQGSFDTPGALLSMLMLASFFLAMDAVGHTAPLWQSGGWLLLATVACWGFVWRQRRARYPLLPLVVFREMRFTLAVSASGLAFIGQGLTFVALSFFYQEQMGFSALETAWLFTPWPLGIMLVGPLAGRLADKINPSLLSSTGLVFLIVGLVALALVDEQTSALGSLWRTALCGIGFGLFQPPNNREMMGSLPPERSANVSGVMSTTRTVGQSLGVALVGAALALGLSIQMTLWFGALTSALALVASLSRVSLAQRALLQRRASSGSR